MKKQIRQTIFFSTIILLASCGKSQEEINNQKINQLEAINEKEISALNDKYLAISRWDSLETFTYVLQEMFMAENKPISFQGELIDISKSDSTYLLKVKKTWDRHYKWDYLAIISISEEKFIEFKKALQFSNRSIEGCFIFKVSKVSSPFPKINIIELDDQDSYFYNNNRHKLLILKGDLIDFHLN